MSKGSSAPSSTTTTTNPPKYLVPYLENIATQATNIFNNEKPQYYPGSTVVPFSSQTQAGLNALQGFQPSAQTNTALNNLYMYGQQPGGLLNDANKYFSDTVNGIYVNQNPYTAGLLKQQSDAIRQGVDSSFATGGRYGSGAHADVLGNKIGDASTQLLSDVYGKERGLQQQAALAAPALQQADIQRLQAGVTAAQQQDASRLQGINNQLTVGGQYEDLQGRQLQEQLDRFYANQNRNGTALDQYIQRINGGSARAGGSTLEAVKTKQNATAGILGGALTGLAGYAGLSQLGAFGGGLASTGGIGASALGAMGGMGATTAGGLIAGAPYLLPFLAGGAALGAFS